MKRGAWATPPPRCKVARAETCTSVCSWGGGVAAQPGSGSSSGHRVPLSSHQGADDPGLGEGRLALLSWKLVTPESGESVETRSSSGSCPPPCLPKGPPASPNGPPASPNRPPARRQRQPQHTRPLTAPGPGGSSKQRQSRGLALGTLVRGTSRPDQASGSPLQPAFLPLLLQWRRGRRGRSGEQVRPSTCVQRG